jgi:hypothetical protein
MLLNCPLSNTQCRRDGTVLKTAAEQSKYFLFPVTERADTS